MTDHDAADAAKPASRRGRPPSTSLSRAKILEAARALIEREGAGALTLRRLGAELGANHTAVLRHFTGKDDIVLGLAEQLIAEVVDGFTPGETWRDTLTALARRLRTACLAHPTIAVLVAHRVSRRDSEFRGADVVVAALQEAGLEPRDRARYYRALVDTALAFASFEAATAALRKSAETEDEAAWQREYLLASPEKYPHLAVVAPYLADIDDEETFETITELLLDAVELRARRAVASSRSR
jgi:TetR/AcrR family transcriptional regulator, tetracycline repressor protein